MASRNDETWRGWWERFARQWEGFGKKGGGERDRDDEEPEGRDGRDRFGAVRSLLLVGLVGAGLMLIGQGTPNEVITTQSVSETNGVVTPVNADYGDVVDELEREVTVVITQIAGVGHAEVLIVPKTSEIKVFAEEVTERLQVSQTSSGGQNGVVTSREESITRRPVIVNNDSIKAQEPLIEHVKKPEVAGVLVVAEGAHDPHVRLRLLQAVSAVLDVPAHRVEILARKK